ncbi:hypothetical protein EWM64_g9057 [Hericium alpestre]|uniref:PEBP-like protein n=1 Tax=Hericium alpestre TaxID=135208 RepID=A0A4Y9ZKH5_9AGAM|nr:hypothetical protein EWM64_g9057 [Hericium alpestre]
MLALRRVRFASRPLMRTNVTVPPATASSPPSPPPPSASAPKADAKPAAAADATEEAPAKTRGRKRYPTRRPFITAERPREWCRPLAPGVLPAYDEALRVIEADSQAVKKEAEEVRAKLADGELIGEEAEKERKRLDILDVMAEVNLPDVRWKAANGLADLSKPVYRHLVEQRWRQEGALDLLMERIHQMNVVPDVLPDLRPSFDLRINFPEPPPQSVYLRTRVKRRYVPVEPGIYLLNEQTKKPPRLYTTVFHTDPRLYTLLMIDPDVPDEENATFTTYLHWLQPNVTLSPSSTLPLPLATTHTPYIPPHPARGTPYHRYVLLLLPQASPTERIHVPTGLERCGFDVRKFIEEYGLRTDGGGAHMWRSVWDEESSRIWNEVIKMAEPRYGHMPRPDPYAELKSKPKYASVEA